MIKDFKLIDNECNGIKEILEFLRLKSKDITSFTYNKSVFLHINSAPIIVNVPGKGLMSVIEILKISKRKGVLIFTDV